MLTPVTHILPLTTIQRRRMLPVAGIVLVRAGQEVRADEVIARTDYYAEHISLDLARGLGVAKNKVADYLKRKIGEDISEGGIVASRPGTIGRSVRAPQAGKLVAVGGGQALLQVSQKPLELKAGIPGRVIKVEADFGATIQTSGAWIQGVWGNGRIGVGGLYVLAQTPEQVLQVKEIDPSRRGQILLAGHCSNPDVFEALVQVKMRGLILGSMPTRLLSVAARMPYPIMVLEGFGRIPINDVAYRLLSTSDQRELSLNAAVFDQEKGERPEAVIPLAGDTPTAVPINLESLKVGSVVRILRAPNSSRVGTVSEILGMSRMPNGLRAEAVEVNLSEDEGEEEMTIVPLANLEILG